jgi:tRNA pseudouridine55 synthase
VSGSGLLVVDKPGGMTSHDVVARIRRALATRRVGHAGTLDPMATGVLVIGVGKATRLLGHLALRDKAYTAVIRLGASTVTDDREGDELTSAPAEAVAAVSDASVRAALARQVGTIDQRPSSVSAVKVDGRRSYDRVRSGEAVELPARRVTISSIDVHDITRQADRIDVAVEVVCSTGTFIRAIARDLGSELGVGGHLIELRRTRVGPFGIDRAIALDDVTPGALLPLNDIAPACFPTWIVDETAARAVRLGQRIAWTGPSTEDGPVAIVDADGVFLALAGNDEGSARYLAVFAEPTNREPADA